ncbi:MAG: peptidylprolyl isomerase [Candidatus Diapherotrites archaeon]
MKIIYLLLISALLFGCVQKAPDAVINSDLKVINSDLNNELNGVENEMNILVEKGDLIKVEYIGSFPDTGEVFDKSEGSGPLEFTAGAGQMIKGFDEAVVGMKLNEEKTVTLPPEKAYGESNPEAIIEVDLNALPESGKTEVGSILMDQFGRKGTITKIENEKATIDFNYELAGKTLEFWIKVGEIKKE